MPGHHLSLLSLLSYWVNTRMAPVWQMMGVTNQAQPMVMAVQDADSICHVISCASLLRPMIPLTVAMRVLRNPLAHPA